jgi:hypothetical protein
LCDVVVCAADAAVEVVELELDELPHPASATAAAMVESSARFIGKLLFLLEDFGLRVQPFAALNDSALQHAQTGTALPPAVM